MYAKFFKRFMDFWLSMLALIVFSPLLLVLTVIGAIAMRGNPYFVQKRPGKKRKNGEERIFSLIKFRTMSNKRDENGNLLPDEIRLNGYGKFLRKTSLDELPELVNILIGDMSFIGPRPLMERYLLFYTEEERQRHAVRPGLTGLAQVHGRNSLSWENRFALDLYYIKHITLLGDIKIFIDTIKIVLKREGIEAKELGNLDDYRKKKEKEVAATDYTIVNLKGDE